MKSAIPTPTDTTSEQLPQQELNGQQLIEMSRTASSRIRRPGVHPSYLVPVVAKTIEIIRLLERSDHPLSLPEVVRETGTSRSTAYRILRTLSAYGYLPRGADGIYCFREPPQPGVLPERSSNSRYKDAAR